MTPEEYVERSLLGILMPDPDRISEVGPQLNGGDFGGPRQQALFTLIREHHTQLAQLASESRAAGHRPDQWASAVITAWPELARNGIDATYLVEVTALAPPRGGGQPAVYAELVMEASIRRQITALGYEATRLSAQTPQVAELLAAQQSITAQLAWAQQRWDSIQQIRDVDRILTPEPAVSGDVDRDLFGRPVLPAAASPAPSGEAVHAAQEQVIGAVLRNAGVADALLGRLAPSDFLNQELGNALDAAQQVHGQAAVTGRQVDPVTVAWALQTVPAYRGRTPAPEYLHELGSTVELNDLDTAVDLVMRSSLAKLTADAAATAQHAAQQPAMAHPDVLAAARAAYQTVETAARRMTGQAGTDYQLGVLNNRATTGSPTTAELADLRSRSTTLLEQTTAGPPGPHTTGPPGFGARLDALDSPTGGQEVYCDDGPAPA